MTSGIALKNSSGVTQIYVCSDPICLATFDAKSKSGDPVNPIEKVFNGGFPNEISYFWAIDAISEESIPPLRRAAMGRYVINLFLTAKIRAYRTASLAKLRP